MARHSESLKLQVFLFAFSRMVFDAAVRMVYPFLDVLSRGMGVSLETMAYALTARNVAGMVSPLLSPVADLRGRKTSIILGLLLFTISMGLMTVWPSFAMFFAVSCLSYLGMFIYFPAVLAYLGDRVPYEQRSRYMGLVELGWSFSYILAIPVFGFMIDRLGWQAPFSLLALLGLLSLGALAWVMPRTPPIANGGFLQQMRRVTSSPSARAGLVLTMCFLTANEVVNLVFGVWVGHSFGLNIIALGAASIVIGISELAGELLTIGITDRLGKERVILAGLVVNALTALVMPWLGQSLFGALTGLFFFYLSFEFTIVSSLPLVSEILPGARASMMGANAAMMGLGRAFGDLLAPQIYKLGFGANALAAIVFDVIAILALLQIRLPSTLSEKTAPATEPLSNSSPEC